MNIVKTKQFVKKVTKLPKKVQTILSDRIRIFSVDPNNVILNNHALSGSLRHYRSINITGDYRLLFEQINDDTIRFLHIDTHHNLYGS